MAPIEPLEPRTLLAHVPVAPGPAPDEAAVVVRASAASRAAPAAAPAALTVADRRELLDHWIGPDARRLRTRLDAGDLDAFDYRLRQAVLSRTAPTFFWKTADVPAYAAYLQQRIPGQARDAVRLADQVLAGDFPEQTTSDPYTVHLGRDFSWRTQPDATDNPEFLYSLNRQGYWLNLATAARVTGKRGYVDEIVRQLQSWSAEVRPPADPDTWEDYGPGWWLLDVAYRADNWLWTYFTIADQPGWTPAANTLFLHRLLKHGQFLYDVSPVRASSNWTTTHARSQLSIGLMFPEFDKSARWAAGGRDLLFTTLAANFRPDGGHVEQSPDYHGGVVADLLEPYLLDKLNGVTWPAEPLTLLRNAATAFYQLLSPDGTQSALSDSFRDDGLPIVSRAGLVLGSAGSGPALPSFSPRLHDVFLLGPAALSGTSAPDDAPLAGRGTTFALPDSGYYGMRSGEDRNARQLIFDAGPKGSGHGHLDLLNIELFGYGRTLVADPGPLRYDDSPDRRWAVSTPAHNTISVDGLSHAAIEKTRRQVVVDYWLPGKRTVEIAAHHHGYAALKGAPVVGRSIWYDRGDVLLVVDWAAGAWTHTFTSSYTLPGLAVRRTPRGGVRSVTGHGDVEITPILLPDGTLPATAAEERFTSSHAPPDNRDPATRFTLSTRGRSATLGALVVAMPDGNRPPDVSAKWLRLPRPGRSGRIELTRAGVKQVIYVAPPDLTPATTTATPTVAMAAAATSAAPAARPAGTEPSPRRVNEVLASDAGAEGGAPAAMGGMGKA